MHFLKDPHDSVFFGCILLGLIVLIGGVSVYLRQFFKLRKNEISLFRQTRRSFLILLGLITSFLAGYSVVLLGTALHYEIDFNSVFSPILLLGALFVLATAYLTNRMFEKLLRSRESLKKQAYQDFMTKLPNRRMITEEIRVALESRKKNPDFQYSVIFIDLLNFKRVNDSFGHNIGDRILIQTSHRLLKTVELSGAVSRLGGDDFVILLRNLSPVESVRMLKKIRSSLSSYYEIDGTQFTLDASYGLYLATHDVSPREAINRANVAMRRSKQRGKNKFSVYTKSMSSSAYDALKFESDFKAALLLGQFELVFQPQFDIQGQTTLSGFEALVRWVHPERGIISPAEFIPMAEETGLIVSLDLHVLNKACAIWSECLKKSGGCRDLHISVNLSAKHITEPSLIKNVTDAISKYGIPPETLCLELTESAFVVDPAFAASRLKALNELGVHCSIDDFGTGYSSLAYLSRFPTQSLKIDRSFIRDIDDGPENIKLVELIIDLAHVLGMKAVAEGVETIRQLENLKELGCDTVQGFYLGRPMPSHEAGKLMKAHKSVSGPEE
ncbi:putative bifunctional diguanylate cyclase/phosphodiesterase [Maridesulfovibrio sp. FT414]|uniref:putative bifunctional diguanylate cyclase/phosphodiesterase n=1 Tax=Maridesulfovibrio sp. FT414 TaxID=2979469 RepID=UPI003D801960